VPFPSVEKLAVGLEAIPLMQQIISGIGASQEIRIFPGNIAECNGLSYADLDVCVWIAASQPRSHARETLKVGNLLLLTHRAKV